MLSPIQQEIVEQKGNLIVRASAGTGKTYTMVEKIVYDIKSNKTYKCIAAITFTIKAANEIKERLKVDSTTHFVGTNNSFVIEEIIKPFMKDVYGMEYKLNIGTDYSVKVDDFDSGVETIRTNQIICSYGDNKRNFVFELALKILIESKACQLYFKAKYFKIYVDEYQDCDKDMHNFFMYICEKLGIELFVVGDEKQSIYMWRGAFPEAFVSIWSRPDFSKKFMNDNYRSCQQIQNYTNLLCEETKNLYVSADEKNSIILIKTSIDNWVEAVKPYINIDEKCALLRYSNKNASSCANSLTDKFVEFTYVPQTPISIITTDEAWLYNSIAKYFILPRYSVYDFRDEIPSESLENKRVVVELRKFLATIEKNLNESNLVNFIRDVKNLAIYLGYRVSESYCEKLYQTILQEEYHSAFKIDMLDKISITFHSAKGLEFEQVILFVSDYKLETPQDIYNHYVACTRAKTKLVMVCFEDEWADKCFLNNINGILEKSNLTVEDVLTVVEF